MFNLPEQPLASALNAVGAKTGLELFYDTNLVVHHRTHDLRGSLTVNEALSILLAGSGLVARSIAVGAVTIAPLQRERTGSQPQARPDLSRHAAYFAVVQDGFARAFCAQGEGTPIQRAVLRFTIKPSGAIDALQMLALAGQSEPDKTTIQALGRVILDQPPPPDLPQPVMMLIRSPTVADAPPCAPAGSTESAARAVSAGIP